jgi:hypothetical protein
MEQVRASQQKDIKETFSKWESGASLHENRKAPMDSLIKNIKQQFDYQEEDVI